MARFTQLDKHTTDLSTIITAENVRFLGENIALCALKHFLPFKPKIEKLYFGLIQDIRNTNNIRHTLSDGYDFAQTAICFLCEHLGKSLGDTVIGKYKKPVTIRHACFSEVGSLVYKYCKYQSVSIHKKDFIKTPEPFEEEKEKSYDRVDEIIAGLHLTQKQILTLDCYRLGMGVSEIARQLSVNTSTVWRSRIRIQQKYSRYISLS